MLTDAEVYITRLPGLRPIDTDNPAVVPLPNCGHGDCLLGVMEFLEMLQSVEAQYEIQALDPNHSEAALYWGGIVMGALPHIAAAKESGADLARAEEDCERWVVQILDALTAHKDEPFNDGVMLVHANFSLN